MILKITKLNKKKIRLKRYLFFSIILNFSAIPFMPEGGGVSVASIMYGASMLIWVIANVFSNFFIFSYDFIGEIDLNSKFIKIDNEIFNISDIKRISVIINSFHGESTRVSSMSIKEGSDNIFKISTINGDKMEYSFYIKFQREINTLRQYLHYYKQKGNIDIYMRIGKNEVTDLMPKQFSRKIKK